jgi:hypothetical protein
MVSSFSTRRVPAVHTPLDPKQAGRQDGRPLWPGFDCNDRYGFMGGPRPAPARMQAPFLDEPALQMALVFGYLVTGIDQSMTR